MSLRTGLLLIAFSWGAASPTTGTVYRTGAVSNVQEIFSQLQPGDAVVFDGDSKPSISVDEPVHDVQFIGGSASWSINADMIDCGFYWHSPRIEQKGGRIRRCVFYKSASSRGMFFSHVDSVSFYYNGGYMFPKNNPDGGQTPQLQFNGFVRGLFVHKPVTSLQNYSKRNGKHAWDWPESPSLRIYADHPEGNGIGTYIQSPIVWEQTNWIPFHIARGFGITFAHVNTEYGRWASPIADFDFAVRCMLLCNGPGATSEATNDPYKDIDLLTYPDQIVYGCRNSSTPYRGATFRMGGMGNKAVAGSEYKTHAIGPKDFFPARHFQDGVTARDPYFQQYPSTSVRVSTNFAPARRWVEIQQNGEVEVSGTQSDYPLEGADVIRPVIMPPRDLRAPRPGLEDYTGRTPEEIVAALNDEGKEIYLGAGTYSLPSALTDGLIYGEGIGKTIVQFKPDNVNSHKGFINCTVRGGKYGITQCHYFITYEILRVRFENMTSAVNIDGCTQNNTLGDFEAVECTRAIGVNSTDGCCGEPFRNDKLNIINVVAKDCDYGMEIRAGGNNKNGFVAVSRCRFENIENTALSVFGGGTHMIQDIYVKNCRMTSGGAVSVSSKYGVSASYVTIDNSEMEAADEIGLNVRGTGAVSHARLLGFAGNSTQSVNASGDIALDHVTSDGMLDGGVFVAKSEFSDFSVGISDSKVAVRNNNQNTLYNATSVVYDQTPPPAVTEVQISGLDILRYPHYESGTLISWDPVDDPESGIIAYAVFSQGKEIGRTPGRRCGPRFQVSSTREVTTHFWIDTEDRSPYEVKPINGAYLLPNGNHATVRRWGFVRPRYQTDDGIEFRAHVIDVESKTVTDTVRDLTIDWTATSGSPRLINTCSDDPVHASFPTAVVAPWGVPSLEYGKTLSAKSPRARSARTRAAVVSLTGGVLSVHRRTALTVRIYDLKGRVILWQSRNFQTGKYRPVDNLERVAPGSYVITVKADCEVHRGRFSILQ